MKREFLQSLRVGEQVLPKEVIDAIMEEHGKAIQGAKVWQEKYEQAQAEHAEELKRLQFGSMLNEAIIRSKGRNAKAITALLDVENLQTNQDPAAAVEQALEKLKKDSSYLFEQEDIPPLYARGTGAQQTAPKKSAATLAGALRERFEKHN